MDFQSITYEISQRYMSDHLESVAKDLTDATNGFRRSRSLKDLATCSKLFDTHKHGVNDWKYLRQIEAFFKKNRCFSDRRVLHEASLVAFRASEAQCAETNQRVTDILLGGIDISAKTRNVLFRARQWIARVLGDFRSFQGDLHALIGVTSGASANTSRKNSIPQLKLSLKPYCSSKAIDLVLRLYWSYGFSVCRPRVCDSNRIELVPKDWRKDRTIACEPEGNLAFQIAFDSYAKRRLKRFGIDLTKQCLNQERAMHASVCDDYVTVDFSSASDTVSYAVVAWFIPEPWFEYLDSVRSPRYRGALGEGEYDKFSSMGNGTTFTLETLIFASLCYAVGSRNFLVYGDDVIIEKEFYDEFKALAELLGFTINTEKSFSSGPFRESCGGEYFQGIDVTPVAIKTIDERKACLCHLVNSLGVLTTPDEGLGSLLSSITASANLPYVPHNESTMSGVWIDPCHAWKSGKLQHRQISKRGPRLDYFKAYVPLTGRRTFVDSRGYYLWFLARTNQVAWSVPWDTAKYTDRSATQTSTVTIFEHRYVRKWVAWHKPRNSTPLYALLLSQKWLV